MKKDTDLRYLALDSLLAVENENRKSSDVINETLEKYGVLPKTQRSFYKRLTEGTLELKIKLDYIISCYSKVPLKKIRPVIKNILRLSLYQLTQMDSVPESAAVNEAVKLTKKKGFVQLSGFVNAVLRSFLNKPELLHWPDENDVLKYISVMYSMPEYLVGKWLVRFGKDETIRICKWFLETKTITVRLRGDEALQKKTLKELEDYGVRIEKAPFLDYAWRITGFDVIDEIEAFRDGRIYVQDLSSMLAVEAAQIEKGDTVMDLCAAPGGKTVLAADKTGDFGIVFSFDISERKTELIRENALRCGIRNIKVKIRDASVEPLDLKESADVVIADVPCSGYGVIGHKADIKYRAGFKKEEALKDLQKKIMNTSAMYLKEGGTLLYCTCTISETENEDNISEFIEESGFEPADIKEYLPHELFENNISKEKYCLQILPGNAGCDGFFIACLKKPLKRKM